MRAPAVLRAIAQAPAATAAVQLLTPSVTVTLPLGTGPPWAVGVTEKPTVTDCPTLEGFGAWLVIPVVVS